MSNTYGKQIFNTVLPLLGNNKPFQRNYTDKCKNVRKYKISTKTPISNGMLKVIKTGLKNIGVPVTKVENYHVVYGCYGSYNKVIITTKL